MLHLKNILIICLFIFAIASCAENKVAEPETVIPAKDIHEVTSNIGTAEGEDVFKTNCLTCHSLRYIQMQPDFPRKNWEKIVDKMIKTFGAPIPDSTAKTIVDYLVTVKGLE